MITADVLAKLADHAKRIKAIEQRQAEADPKHQYVAEDVERLFQAWYKTRPNDYVTDHDAFFAGFQCHLMQATPDPERPQPGQQPTAQTPATDAAGQADDTFSCPMCHRRADSITWPEEDRVYWCPSCHWGFSLHGRDNRQAEPEQPATQADSDPDDDTPEETPEAYYALLHRAATMPDGSDPVADTKCPVCGHWIRWDGCQWLHRDKVLCECRCDDEDIQPLGSDPAEADGQPLPGPAADDQKDGEQ